MSACGTKRTRRLLTQSGRVTGELFVSGRNCKSHRMLMRLKPGGDGHGRARKIRSKAATFTFPMRPRGATSNPSSTTRRAWQTMRREAKG